MDIQSVRIEKPEAINFILGQSHFIKTVEDIHEALVTMIELARQFETNTKLISIARENDAASSRLLSIG